MALEGKEGQLLGWPVEHCALPFVDVGRVLVAIG